VAVVLGLRVDVQGMVQTWGSMGSSRPAWCMRLCRGRGRWGRGFDRDKAVGAGGRQVVRSAERPPPGTIEWMCGWDWSCRPRDAGPGEPWEVRADEALVGGQPLESRGRRLQPRLGREAVDGSGGRSERLRTGKVRRKCGPGSCCSGDAGATAGLYAADTGDSGRCHQA